MYNILIDKNTSNYQIQYLLSEINFFDYDFSKYSRVYIKVDNVNLFRHKYKLFTPKNTVFLFDNDVIIPDRFNFNITKVSSNVGKMSFIQKVCKNNFIYRCLFG